MAINRLVSIKNPIINAMDMAALDHDNHLPLFTQWATEAEMEIGSYYQFTRQWALLDVCGCTAATIPCNAVKIEASVVGNHMDNCCGVFGNILGTDGPFLNPIIQNTTGMLVIDIGSGDNSNTYGQVQFHVQNNKLIFDAKYGIKQITIQYIGYELDCDGFMMVGENHIQAITEYILYKWCSRKRKKSGADLQEMQWHYTQWDRLCAHSRALDAELTPTDREEIAQIYNNPLAGRGLFLGMTNPNSYGYGRTGNY